MIRDIDVYSDASRMWWFVVRRTHDVIGTVEQHPNSYVVELSSGRTATFLSFRSASAYVMLWADDLEADELDAAEPK